MSFFTELKRRNVFRVAIAYVVACWLLIQGADLVLDVVGAADWVLRTVAALLALGFIPTVIFAWAFEITPEGVKKESEVDRSGSITHHTAKKLDMITIGLLVAAIALVALDRFTRDGAAPQPAPALASEENPAQPVTAGEAPEKSIAVLPFANRSNQDDDLFFTDGIHDDLLTQLAKINELKVISRTSMMEYRGTTKNLKEIGNELGVGTILEGGIQKVGNRVRINAQLIDVNTDQHLWAETFDRELTAENIFDIQSEIAREIVRAVTIELTPEELESLTAVPTRNLAAYEAYLRGRELMQNVNYSAQAEQQALPWLEKAIELDPGYADAYALLADVYGQQIWRGIDTSDEMVKRFESTIKKAENIDPDAPLVILSRANYYYRLENDYQASLDLVEKALAIAPGVANSWSDRALSLRRLGRWQESIDSFKKALELDPANRYYRALMVETMESIEDWQGMIDATVPLADARPDEMDIQLGRANAQFQLTGDLKPMKQVLSTMNLEASTHYLTTSAWVHMYDRDAQAAIETLHNPIWMQMSADELVGQHQRNYQLGEAYLLNGDTERATENFQKVADGLEHVMDSSIQTKAYGGMVSAISLAHLGRIDEALAAAEQIASETPYELDAMLIGWILYHKALVHGVAGDQDAAMEYLRISLETPTAMRQTRWNIHVDPRWDFMRDNPDFVALTTPDNLIRTTN